VVPAHRLDALHPAPPLDSTGPERTVGPGRGTADQLVAARIDDMHTEET
jgi:hypothetical protein